MVLNSVKISDCVQSVETWNPLKAGSDDEFVYVDLSAVDQDLKTVAGSKTLACHDAPSRARQLVRADDVLVSTVRPNLNGVALVDVAHDGAIASTGFCVLRADPEKLDPHYLFQWVKSSIFVDDMVRKATGASYPAVSDRIIFDSRLPLPSLSEQRRIAAILDQADALRSKRREALAQLDSLTQSIFMEMFEGDRKLPQLELRDICELITDGTHYTPTYADEGTIFLSAKNVTSGYVDWVNIKYIPEALHLELQKRVAPRRGDVLLAKNGTTGIAAIVDRECVFDIYVSLALLRPSSEVLSTYLHAAINSPLTKRQFDGALKGIGVPNLHLKDIRLARIPKPTLEAQKTFATRIHAVEALKTQHRAALTELDALFASLQHRAFQGEL
jgi:type I restriction enzyme S subunit